MMQKIRTALLQFGKLIEKIIKNPLLNGAITFLGFLGFVFGNSHFIVRLVSFSIMILFGWLLIKDIYQDIFRICRNFFAILTWKFFAGILLGLLIGIVSSPWVIQPALVMAGKIIFPEIKYLRSEPDDNHFLSANSRITIQFSDPIPWPYTEFVSVKIIPKYKIKDSLSQNWLTIEPDESYRGYNADRFEFDSKYTVIFSIPGLIQEERIRFCTPKKGENLDTLHPKKCLD
ncbi:MAG: hypothetical protein AAFY76_17860 [Cyanobacteria bacterium J06649_11]